MRLIISPPFYRLDVSCYGLDPVQSVHCMPSIFSGGKHVSHCQPGAVTCDFTCTTANGRTNLVVASQAYNFRFGEIRMDCLRRNFSPITEELVMNKTTSTLIGAAIALAMSGGAYAQSNNTLATPSTMSPVHATSGYGTPGGSSSDSGMAAAPSNSGMQQSPGNSATSLVNVPGSHNTLATPSTASPAGQ
jgi:hypothetical protein